MLVCDVDGCGHAQVAAPVCVCTCACVHVGPQTCTASRRLVVMVEEQERSLQSRRVGGSSVDCLCFCLSRRTGTSLVLCTSTGSCEIYFINRSTNTRTRYRLQI